MHGNRRQTVWCLLSLDPEPSDLSPHPDTGTDPLWCGGHGRTGPTSCGYRSNCREITDIWITKSKTYIITVMRWEIVSPDSQRLKSPQWTGLTTYRPTFILCNPREISIMSTLRLSSSFILSIEGEIYSMQRFVNHKQRLSIRYFQIPNFWTLICMDILTCVVPLPDQVLRWPDTHPCDHETVLRHDLQLSTLKRTNIKTRTWSFIV